jgi:hypothetical protein
MWPQLALAAVLAAAFAALPPSAAFSTAHLKPWTIATAANISGYATSREKVFAAGGNGVGSRAVHASCVCACYVAQSCVYGRQIMVVCVGARGARRAGQVGAWRAGARRRGGTRCTDVWTCVADAGPRQCRTLMNTRCNERSLANTLLGCGTVDDNPVIRNGVEREFMFFACAPPGDASLREKWCSTEKHIRGEFLCLEMRMQNGPASTSCTCWQRRLEVQTDNTIHLQSSKRAAATQRTVPLSGHDVFLDRTYTYEDFGGAIVTLRGP